MTSKLFKLTLACIAFLVLNGCAYTMLNGKKFSEAPPPKSNEALLYIYRIHGGPHFRSPDITINDKMFIDLQNLGYSYKYLSPGEYSIKTKWSIDLSGRDREVNLKIKSGETYYIQLYGNTNYSYKSYFELVPNDKAKKEILECCLLIDPNYIDKQKTSSVEIEEDF